MLIKSNKTQYVNSSYVGEGDGLMVKKIGGEILGLKMLKREGGAGARENKIIKIIFKIFNKDNFRK